MEVASKIFQFMLAFLFSNFLKFSSTHAFCLTLKTQGDNLSTFGWNFPRNRPYHYFNSTQDIPNTFLPVLVSDLPEGDGLWVLRYKDFSGESRTFEQSKTKETSKSIINYSSSHRLFSSVTIKAIAFGDASFDLVFNNGQPDIWNKEGETKTERQKISLLDYNENCTQSNANATNTDGDKGLKWMVYKVETTSTGHMNLEAKIYHPKSFIILDEILMKFDVSPSAREWYKDANDTISDIDLIDIGNNNKFGCKIIM